jgi:hypothetical protein
LPWAGTAALSAPKDFDSGEPRVVIPLCAGIYELACSDRDECAASFAALPPELRINRLEVTDLNFELVFLECIRQDGSGEKGFEALDQNFVFQVERESPQSFPHK